MVRIARGVCLHFEIISFEYCFAHSLFKMSLETYLSETYLCSIISMKQH